jgi:hypothetical protein
VGDTPAAQQGFAGQQTPWDENTPGHMQRFMAEQILGRVNTAMLCKVQAVSGGGNASVGTVDVLPLAKMMDGLSNTFSHGVINNLPYFRLQGGKNAVIIDPKAGDIGVAVFADRDISGVKRSKKEAPPGSFRRFDMADGLFFPCFLGEKPDNRVEFADGNKIFVYQKDTSALVVTKDYVQMKNKSSGMHVTIDVKQGKYLVGGNWEIASDPNSGEPSA